MGDSGKRSQAVDCNVSVQVRTLGGFDVEVGGALLPVSGRGPRPLELLATLIALGGRDVPIARLADVLWPDSDGDRAQRTLTTTLHRLRKLLGHAALRLHQGRLSLSDTHCWVDALAFAATAALPAGGPPSDADCSALEAALALYRGPFLAGAAEQPAMLAMQERLRAQFLACSEAVGLHHERAHRTDAAIQTYERALAIEPHGEALCRRLMAGLCGSGQAAEAVAVYGRFRQAALARDGSPPGADTLTLLQEALDARDAEVPVSEMPSLAVLPFASLARSSGSGWLAAGFTENLTASLSRLPRLTLVDSRALGAAFGHQRIRDVARELGVRYVFSGTVQRDGKRLRVTVQLLAAATEQHLWAEQYDRVLTDAFAVQDDIVQSILVALQVQLTEGEQARSLWRHTDSVEAWELALRGLEHFRRFDRLGNLEARRLWEQALELDSDYVMALVPLGWTHTRDAQNSWGAEPTAALGRAEALAQRSMQVDPGSGPAHALLAHVRILERRHAVGLRLLERARELNPSGADTAVIVGQNLANCGLPEEGLAEVQRGMRLAPFYPGWYLSPLARCHYLAGQYAEALRALHRGTLARRMTVGRVILAASHAAVGELEAARADVRDLLRSEPGFTRAERLPWRFPLLRAEDATRLNTHLSAAGCP